MYYVLGFRRASQGLGGFHATSDGERALRTRFAWEHENLQDGVQHDEEVVVVSAPDLFTLTRTYERYFVRYARVGISECYFCRAYLGWEGDRPGVWEVELLSKSAYANGHCLLCHQPYRVWCPGGHYHLDWGLQEHAEECAVLRP